VYDLSTAGSGGRARLKLMPEDDALRLRDVMDGEQVFTLFNTAAWAPLTTSPKRKPRSGFFIGVRWRTGPRIGWTREPQVMSWESISHLARKRRAGSRLEPFRFRADQEAASKMADAFRVGYLYRFR